MRLLPQNDVKSYTRRKQDIQTYVILLIDMNDLSRCSRPALGNSINTIIDTTNNPFDQP